MDNKSIALEWFKFFEEDLKGIWGNSIDNCLFL